MDEDTTDSAHHKRGGRLKLIVTVVTSALGITSGTLGLREYRDRHPGVDISGEWQLENTLESTTRSTFQGMRLGYRVFFQQDGRNVHATGEKVSENGQSIPSSAHTPIAFSGIIKGRKLTGPFVEQGTKRESTGKFEWTISSDEERLSGTFTSTAASASGPSVCSRVKRP
jgi:hypothetical protein